jgi:hypothetical protein
VLTVEEIKKKIEPVVKKYNVPEAYLFGSRARGEGHEHSDVDIAIKFSDSDIDNLLDIAGLEIELEEALGVDVDISDSEALEDEDLTFRYVKNNYLNERVKIYEAE